MGNLYLVTGTINPQFDFSNFIYEPDDLVLSLDKQHYLEALGTITLCASDNWMPYEASPQGQHQGLVKDYMSLIAQRLNLNIEVISTESWPQALSLMRSGLCDLIPGTMATPYRGHYLKFSTPYLSMPAVMAVHNSRDEDTSPSDLNSARVGLVSDSAFYEIIKNRYPNAEVIPVNSIIDGLRQVEKGDLYGFIDAPASISRVLQRHHMLDISIQDSINDQWDIGVAVRQDNERLLAVFNQAIKSLSPEDHQAIANRWLNVRYNHEFDYSLLWQILAGLALLLLLFAYRYKVISDYNRKLRVIAQYDQLTGIYNRHKLYESLEYALNVSRRYKRSSALVFFDVDDFKKVNDTFGHSEGDRVLVGITEIVAGIIRKSDRFGRWGGEEFLLILPESKLNNALQLAEKLRNNIYGHDFCLNQHRLSCSFGVTVINPEDSVESLIIRVDEALYKAKHTGKNCVVQAEFPSSESDPFKTV
ncbi:MAG: diguanylate cyclase [Pontibacterium sp.]